MNHFVALDGQSMGPYSLPDLVLLYHHGLIHSATQCRLDAPDAEWQPLSKALPTLDSIYVPSRLPQHVAISDVPMSFGRVVAFMVRWAIASIPAAIIIFILIAVFLAIFGAFFGGLAGLLHIK
jgi:hypothetical protein